MLDALSAVALVAAAVSAASLGGLLAYALLDERFTFWPAPWQDSWQFSLAFGLFRVFCGATIVYALTDWGSMDWAHWSRLAIGAPLMLAAFAATLYGYFFLGIENTYCEAEGLVTGGVYAYSRNPQYVASVLATVGLALTTGSWGALAMAGVLLAIYTLFALNEERWLWRTYGHAFGRYAKRTPRFVDGRSVRRARHALVEAL
jgi:protein-S-isoprenylcysteine O-methyltransferase Ste14